MERIGSTSVWALRATSSRWPHTTWAQMLQWMTDAEEQGVLQIKSHRPQICIARTNCKVSTVLTSSLRRRKNRIPNPFVALTSTSSSNCLAASASKIACNPTRSLPERVFGYGSPGWIITIGVINVLKGIWPNKFYQIWIIQFQSNQPIPFISILVAMPGAYSFWSIFKHTLALEAYE